MNPKRALKMAIDALSEARAPLAPEANMARLYGVQTPTTLRAAKMYADYTAAIEELREMWRNAPMVYSYDERGNRRRIKKAVRGDKK